MEVSVTSSRGDSIVLIVGCGVIRGVGCVVILVLAHVWHHSILLKKILRPSGVARERRHARRRSERSTLLRVSPNAVAATHTMNIWHRHAITLVLNARVQGGRAPLGVVTGAVHGRCDL